MFTRLFVILMAGHLSVSTANDHVFNSHGDAEKPDCKSNAHVCTSLMKYPDGSEVDEGPYCKCPGCSSQWKPDDYKSLSWAHFERPDKIIQYKFCVPIIPARECEPGDLAITLRTATVEWSPHVHEPRCSCPGHMYELLGWWRHPTHKHDNTTGVWLYEYFCGKPVCQHTNMPCSKIYIDPHNKDPSTGEPLTVGYNFLCSCQSGYKCPDRDEDEENPKKDTDFRGTHYPRYCEPVHQGDRR